MRYSIPCRLLRLPESGSLTITGSYTQNSTGKLDVAINGATQGTQYSDLGPDFFERRDVEGLTRHLVDRLERLGHKVKLESQVA